MTPPYLCVSRRHGLKTLYLFLLGGDAHLVFGEFVGPLSCVLVQEYLGTVVPADGRYGVLTIRVKRELLELPQHWVPMEVAFEHILSVHLVKGYQPYCTDWY